MGVTLATLIQQHHITPSVMVLMQQQAVEAIALAFQEEGRVGDFDEYAFEFDPQFKHTDFKPSTHEFINEATAIARYGKVLLATIEASPHKPRRLVAIARQCSGGQIESLNELHLQLQRSMSNPIYITLITLITLLLGLLWWLNQP